MDHQEDSVGFDELAERHLVTFPESGPAMANTDAAARVLCDYFLVNAERGDNAANDELVAELVRRIRSQARGIGARFARTVAAAAITHQADQ
ncbi:MAG TPA: hypothetical protein VGL88_03140 [Pseudonocardiaceae bacterium]|jgi:hypothetical protein